MMFRLELRNEDKVSIVSKYWLDEKWRFLGSLQNFESFLTRECCSMNLILQTPGPRERRNVNQWCRVLFRFQSYLFLVILQPNIRNFLPRLSNQQFLFKNVIQCPWSRPSKAAEVAVLVTWWFWAYHGRVQSILDHYTIPGQHPFSWVHG